MGADPASSARRLAPTLLLAVFLAGCVHTPPPSPPATLEQVVSLETPDRALLATAIFRETNRIRMENQVAPLRTSSELDSAADVQAVHMALMLRSEHSNPIPGEHTAAERVSSTGFVAARVAENAIVMPARSPAGSPQVAYTYSGLAAALVRNWMLSPGHRANLLSHEVTRLGCAARFAKDALGDPMVFATQVFALPASFAGEPK
jgi:uncharacterized protein YkwD